MTKSIAKELDCIETKGVVTMALASDYWSRDQIWCKLFGLFLAAKGLMMVPPWQSADGRLALQKAILTLTKSAQYLPMAVLRNMKKLLG